MFYKNARIFTSDFPFHHGAFEGTDGRFGAVLPEAVPEDAIDLGVSEHAAIHSAATEVGLIAP